jgi:phosphoglycolate phosphatase
MSRNLRAVLCDLDGTLLDSLALTVAASNAVRGQHGLPAAPAAEIIAGMVLPTAPRMAALCRQPAAAGTALGAAFFAAALAMAPQLVRAYPGVVAALAHLRRAGCRLGGVSNNLGQLVRCGAAACGVAEHLALILGEEDMAAYKPDPAGLLQAAVGLGVAPADCAYVGDTAGDMEAALAAGMTPVAVTWGIGSAAALRSAGARLVLKSAEELASLPELFMDKRG